MQVLKDKNRRDITLTTSKTGEVLPEWFLDQNEKIITLLDKYYEFLDSDGVQGFNNIINDVIHARDVAQTDETYLDELIKEIGDGLESSSFFHQPRLMAKLLAGFYRSKGSIVSAEGFFRGFFNEEVDISYPKKDIFIVGQDEIGFDSQKFIQDNKLYQIFSILVKVGISTQDYETLYKKFVHPAGFHFAGEVISVDEGLLATSGQGLEPLDSGDLSKKLTGEGTMIPVIPFSELTFLVDSDGTDIRMGATQLVNLYAQDPTITANVLSDFYGSIESLITPNSFKFDDSNNPGPDFSMTFETMDNDMFVRYTSDSSY